MAILDIVFNISRFHFLYIHLGGMHIGASLRILNGEIIMRKKASQAKFLLLILLTVFGSIVSTTVGQEQGQILTIPIDPDLNAWKLKGPPLMSKWKAGVAEIDALSSKKLKVAETSAETMELVNKAKDSLDIYTKKSFGDCIIELEVMVAEKANSGIYVMGQYEVQVKDSFGKSWLLGAGDMGGIVGTSKPKRNAAKKPGEWQKYVLEFKAPRFKNKRRSDPAEFVKVILNGVIVQEHVKMKNGPTSGALRSGEFAEGPLMLQGGLGAVAYRNIRITAR